MGGIIPAPDEVLGALGKMVKEDVAQHEEAY
jgi:hypothetical protein